MQVSSTVPIDDKVEIARSFSYKLNVGNYESRDFFCSQKATCSFADAETISQQLLAFCQQQVRNDVAEYKRAMSAAKPQPEPG
jgi:hypothetical protein